MIIYDYSVMNAMHFSYSPNEKEGKIESEYKVSGEDGYFLWKEGGWFELNQLNDDDAFGKRDQKQIHQTKLNHREKHQP